LGVRVVFTYGVLRGRPSEDIHLHFLIVLMLREKFRLTRRFNSNAGCVNTEGEGGGRGQLGFFRGKYKLWKEEIILNISITYI
jgi:hypothetical protein